MNEGTSSTLEEEKKNRIKPTKQTNHILVESKSDAFEIILILIIIIIIIIIIIE